jgi:multiple antibiotic resistance protein
MIRDVLSFSIISLSAVFVVVDPLAAVPFFLVMTKDDTAEQRRETARRAAWTAFLVLSFFALAGAIVFKALGITIAAFKMAGGVLLLIMAIDMLRTRASEARITDTEVQAGALKEDVAIVPLAMPLLAGPGAIATVVVLMGRARAGERWWQVFPVLASIALVALSAYLILGFATQVDRVLGRTGLAILERVAGLLLAAIAFQFLIDGVGDVLPSLLRRV